MKMGCSPLVNTMPIADQRIHVRPRHPGCGLVDNNFGTMNDQNSNNFGNMGNVGSMIRLNQPLLFNYTSNYNELLLTSSRGLYRPQTGPLGEALSHISSRCNLLSEKNKGKMPLEMDAKAPLRPPDLGLDPFNKFATSCQFLANFLL